MTRRRLARIGDPLLVANVAIVALTVLAVANIAPRWPIWVLAIAFGTVSTIAVIVMARVRNRVRAFVGALTEAEHRVVDPAFALVPPSVAALIGALESLGFRVVGVTDTAVQGRPDFRTWILVEPSGETWVEAGEAGQAIAVFLSGTPGGRQVEAAWPRGMDVDEPELLAAPASGALELTLADHRARLAAERRTESQFGAPLLDAGRPDGWRIRTFEDYLAWEPKQRKRTGGLRLKTDLRRRIEPAVRHWGISTAVGLACSALLSTIR